MARFTDLIPAKWFTAQDVKDGKAWVYDPEEIATLFIDGLYIGLIYGKENIKFLKEKIDQYFDQSSSS
mgnify:CR=1 FL=1